MIFVVKMPNVDLEGRPFRDLLPDRIAIVEGDQRAPPTDRTAMILRRLDEMADKSQLRTLCAPAHRCRLVLADWECQKTMAAGLQGPIDLAKDLGRLEYMLHHVECDHQIEAPIGKSLRRQIFMPAAAKHRLQPAE